MSITGFLIHGQTSINFRYYKIFWFPYLDDRLLYMLNNLKSEYMIFITHNVCLKVKKLRIISIIHLFFIWNFSGFFIFIFIKHKNSNSKLGNSLCQLHCS